MASKTTKRDVYVVSLQESGNGNVRVVLRDGDPPHARKEGENIPAAPAPRGEDLTVSLPADDAPGIYETLTLTLSKRSSG